MELLREHFDVEVGVDWDGKSSRSGSASSTELIRSATKLTPELIARAERLKVIGRAGTGVDNVDVEAATKRGIVVANAPEANSIAAAEHTLALMLALCRNVPEAHASLAGGKWDRGSFKGSELYGKTLGVLGFGRIGQLVAARARAFEMRVIAYDKFVTAERFRELGAEGVDDPDELFARADFISLHLEDAGDRRHHQRKIDREDARGRPDRQLRARRAGRSGRPARRPRVGQGRGAALDVFPEEPFEGHPITDRSDVVVTPHLGASTAEAQDRAGVVTAEQVRRRSPAGW